MELFEYIKSQLPQMPNVVIMKQLGASDELVEYVKETSWNTNLNMLAVYGCEPSEGTDKDAWFRKRVDDSCASIYPSDGNLVSEADWEDLRQNPTNYKVEINGTPTTLIHDKTFVEAREAYFTTFESEEYGFVEIKKENDEQGTVEAYFRQFDDADPDAEVVECTVVDWNLEITVTPIS